MNLSARQKLFAWLQLLRLPNVFTAVADVTMGYLVTHRNLEPPAHFALLAAASCLLYLSGMVLNDVFDAEVDAHEQPSRPIPSGRISLRNATAVGWAMLAGGIFVAWFASALTSDVRPGVIATILAACIVLYDRILKRTPIAPLAMGACRMLNVFLGMSLVVQNPFIVPGLRLPGVVEPVLPARWWFDYEWMFALGLGIYVVGVTIFARTDARTSSRRMLIAGLIVLLTGIATLAITPVATGFHRLVVIPNGWFLLWALLAIITGRRCLLAVMQPTSQNVQAAVRHCVLSIIVVDAAVCVGYAGPLWGFTVLALIFPAVGFAAWIRAT